MLDSLLRGGQGSGISIYPFKEADELGHHKRRQADPRFSDEFDLLSVQPPTGADKVP